jgi:hypothetical protein
MKRLVATAIAVLAIAPAHAGAHARSVSLSDASSPPSVLRLLRPHRSVTFYHEHPDGNCSRGPLVHRRAGVLVVGRPGRPAGPARRLRLVARRARSRRVRRHHVLQPVTQGGAGRGVVFVMTDAQRGLLRLLSNELELVDSPLLPELDDQVEEAVWVTMGDGAVPLSMMSPDMLPTWARST